LLRQIGAHPARIHFGRRGGVNSYYSPSHNAGVLWNDQDLDIRWPVAPDSIVLSEKDRRQPRLRDLPHYFDYKGVSTKFSCAPAVHWSLTEAAGWKL
jgi:hypothetical protein